MKRAAALKIVNYRFLASKELQPPPPRQYLASMG